MPHPLVLTSCCVIPSGRISLELKHASDSNEETVRGPASQTLAIARLDLKEDPFAMFLILECDATVSAFPGKQHDHTGLVL